MKISAFLMVVILFMTFQFSYGEGNSAISNFSEYANSPMDSSDVSANSEMSTNQETAQEAMKIPEKKERADRPARSEDNQVAQGIPAKWQGCRKDSDCVSAVADCVTWDAINKMYLKKLVKNLRSCSASIDPGFEPQAACISQRCQITDKTMDVSWEEWLSAMQKRR